MPMVVEAPDHEIIGADELLLFYIYRIGREVLSFIQVIPESWLVRDDKVFARASTQLQHVHCCHYGRADSLHAGVWISRFEQVNGLFLRWNAEMLANSLDDFFGGQYVSSRLRGRACRHER